MNSQAKKIPRWARDPDGAVSFDWAVIERIYRETPGLSWESACYSATEQRPDFVPPSWRADPDGNLKREAARYWDKSRYSQLSYRQNRDR